MKSHRYRVGQTVAFSKTVPTSGAQPSGNFRVVALLPDYHGNNQYRVESVGDGHQRVATEIEIEAR